MADKNDSKVIGNSILATWLVQCSLPGTQASAEQTSHLRLELQHATFNYREFSHNREVLNKERGTLMTVNAQGSVNLMRNLHGYAYASIAEDTVSYVGLDNLDREINSTTDMQLARAGVGLAIALSEVSTIRMSAGWSRWEREIQSVTLPFVVSGLDERYRWLEAEFGIDQRVFSVSSQNVIPSATWQLYIGGGVLKTFATELEADLSSLRLGKQTFELKRRFGHHLFAALRLAFKSSNIELGYRMRRWRFGKSQPKQIGNRLIPLTITEPASRSQIDGLTLSWQLNFG